MEKNFCDYHVSKDGVVYSFLRKKWLTPSKQLVNGVESGYLCQTLIVNGNAVRFYVHRLVASVYVENPQDKPWVNHIDGNKGNNHYLNLEWSTIKENIQHSYDSLGRKCNSPMYGKSHSDVTKKVMSDLKKGENHPKFSGYYYFKNSVTGVTFKGCTPDELMLKASLPCCAMTVARRCKKGSENYWFGK